MSHQPKDALYVGDELDEMAEGLDEEPPLDEFEEALANCSGSFGKDGKFRCGAIGSEDCDFECPFHRDIGLTRSQIEVLDAEREATLATCNSTTKE